MQTKNDRDFGPDFDPFSRGALEEQRAKLRAEADVHFEKVSEILRQNVRRSRALARAAQAKQIAASQTQAQPLPKKHKRTKRKASK
ncbi:MAG: hypothetical protein WCV85_02545 [Patescibacteria group bacterium]|jgi:hypothetical protein